MLPPQVCACMLTQHKAQLDARDKNPGMVRPAANPYAVSTITGVLLMAVRPCRARRRASKATLVVPCPL